MTPVARVLDRLQGVRKSGQGRWHAKCPAHDDRGPSLSVREAESGACLVHCFAGCGAVDVVGALGLEMKDLFPERDPTEHFCRPTRQALDARDALACLATEGQVLAVAAENWRIRREFSDADLERISLAAGRLSAAWRACNGHR